MPDLDSLAQDPGRLAALDRTGLFRRAADQSGRWSAAQESAQAALTGGDLRQIVSARQADGPIWLHWTGELAGVGRMVAGLTGHPLHWAGDLPEASRRHLSGPGLAVADLIPPTLHPAQAFLALLMILDELGAHPLPPQEISPAWSGEAWQITVPISDNPAKTLAQQLFVGVPLFWAEPSLAGVDQVWQRRYQIYGEAAAFRVGADELIGSQIMARFPRFWPRAGVIVHLRPATLAPESAHLIAGVEAICKRRQMPFRAVIPPDLSPLQSLWYLLELGEWVALYTAALNDVDPADQVPRQFLEGLSESRP